MSPVQSQISDLTDEACSTSSTNINFDKNGLRSPKKMKLYFNSPEKSPIKIKVHKADQTTQQKENSTKTHLSPKKDSNSKINMKKDDENTNEFNDNSQNKNRSPLTPLSMDKVFQFSQSNSKLEKNNELSKIDGLVNENLLDVVNNRAETPRKVLQFDNHVQNGINEVKKSVIGKNSPSKGKYCIHIHIAL